MPTCQTCPYWIRLNDPFLLEHFGQRGICEEYQQRKAHIDPYSLLWTLPGESCEKHPGKKADYQANVLLGGMRARKLVDGCRVVGEDV